MAKGLIFFKFFSTLTLIISALLIIDNYLPLKISNEKIIELNERSIGGRRSTTGYYCIIKTDQSTFNSELGRSWPNAYEKVGLEVLKTRIFGFVKQYYRVEEGIFEVYEPYNEIYQYIFVTFCIFLFSVLFFVLKVSNHKINIAIVNVFFVFAQIVIYLNS